MNKPSYKISGRLDPKKIKARKPIESKYVFGEMEIGDYFELPESERNAAAVAASRYGLLKNRIYAVKYINNEKTNKRQLVCVRLS